MTSRQASRVLDSKRCRRILGESVPDPEIRSVRYFDSGWDYELWEVNGELLFRFPKRPECAETLRKEARLLTKLAGRLSIAVPRPEYVSEGCEDFPLPFFGYRTLPGDPLDKVTLDEQTRELIAQQLGRFLSELHGFPAERAAELGVPSYSAEGWRAYYRQLREQVRREVLPLLARSERRAVDAFWRRFLDDERHFRFEPVLLHGDLSPEHILVDLERTAITGVIDFGDAVVGDPAGDFGGFTAAFRQAVLGAYDLPVDDSLLDRAADYWKISPFHEVLHGLNIDDQKHIDNGLAHVRLEVVAGA